MEIPSGYVAADRVSVNNGFKVKGEHRLELEIGRGKGSRHSYLTASEARRVAYALLAKAEEISN